MPPELVQHGRPSATAWPVNGTTCLSISCARQGRRLPGSGALTGVSDGPDAVSDVGVLGNNQLCCS